MVGDQVLRFAKERCQLLHDAVAPRQLAHQPPAQGVAEQLKEFVRCNLGLRLLAHGSFYTSI
jgi:hypothetical protein